MSDSLLTELAKVGPLALVFAFAIKIIWSAYREKDRQLVAALSGRIEAEAARARELVAAMQSTDEALRGLTDLMHANLHARRTTPPGGGG